MEKKSKKKVSLVELVDSATEEELALVRAKLGIGVQVTRTVARFGKNYQRTDVKREKTFAKQMNQLIDALPADRKVTIEEWAKLAVLAGMETQQDPVRIAMYYRRNILDAGFATVSE